ncbi:MAG: hypothetical protein MN733_03025, partial [Nitrososphaera sp.]|nr:hypothetical protein [Nitrososphaera sp.]
PECDASSPWGTVLPMTHRYCITLIVPLISHLTFLGSQKNVSKKVIPRGINAILWFSFLRNDT